MPGEVMRLRNGGSYHRALLEIFYLAGLRPPDRA